MQKILAVEQQKKNAVGDHFAKEVTNQRVWNVLEKTAIKDPVIFIRHLSYFYPSFLSRKGLFRNIID